MAATIHLVEGKHAHTPRLLGQHVLFVHARIREICVGISKSPFKGAVCVAVVRGPAQKLALCHVSQLSPEVAVAAPVMEPEAPVVPTALSLCV